MAFITDVHCRECRQTKHEVTDNSGVCQDCRSKAESTKRRFHLAGLQGLTVEERLERIEAQLYDLNAETRLKSLESHHAKYG